MDESSQHASTTKEAGGSVSAQTGSSKIVHLKDMLPEAQALAQAQDRRRWRNFTEGKLSLKF